MKVQSDASSAPGMPSLRTEAWLLRGISSVPGLLVLQGSSLSFTAVHPGTAWPWQLRKLEREFGVPGFAAALAEGSRRTLFGWPVGNFRYWVPWYYFGGGIKVAQGASVLRLSLGRPANAPALLSAAEGLREAALMRRRGKLWLEALGKAAQSARGAR